MEISPQDLPISQSQEINLLSHHKKLEIMKKLLISLFLSVASVAVAQKFTINPAEGGEMVFKVTSKAQMEVALISAENKNSESLIIPETVTYKNKTYTVAIVEKSALKDCDQYLRDLSFPNTVREIKTSLFLSTSTGSTIGKALLGAYTAGLAGNNFGTSKKSPLADVELNSIRISKNTKIIALNAFNTEKTVSGTRPLMANILELPDFITAVNAENYGLSQGYVLAYRGETPNSGIGNMAVQNMAPSAITPSAVIQNTTKNQMKSDVDVNLPKSSSVNENTFVVIIANEEYQKESKVDFAINVGTMFATYCKQVLGIPEKNVHIATNATLNNIIFELDWLHKVCEAYSGAASVLVYYAGHGVPDEASGTAYLLPVDGVGQNLRTCYSLAEFYKTLGAMPTRNLTVIMDACFSGAKRSGEMMASARGVAIKAKPTMPKSKMVVLSAAQGDETAYAYKENNHGLFTYFLLKKLKETKGKVTLGELGDYITQEVKRHSIVENGKSQTPSVIHSGLNDDDWMNRQFAN